MDTTDPDMAIVERLMMTEPEESQAEEAAETDAETPQEEATAEAPEAETDGAEDDAQDEPEAATQPELYTVKVDGREVQVTRDELIRGYAGQAYIQQGMQEAAAKRKEAEALAQALQDEQRRFLEFAQTVQTTGLRAPPTPPNPALAQTNPTGYTQAFAKYQADLQAYQGQQAQIARMQQAQEAAQQAAQEAYLAEQANRLRAVLPEIVDPAKGPEVRRKLIDAGVKHYGFSEAEVMGVMDARAVQVLHDAARYRELMAQKATAKAAPPPPKNVVPKAKASQPPQASFAKLKQQARKSQKEEDFVRLLLTPET